MRSLTAPIIRTCVEESGSGYHKTAGEIFREMRVRRIDLSRHGDSGVVVQGSGSCMCGAVGNCPIWFLSDKPHPAVLIRALGVQTFAAQERPGSARYEIFLGTHDSATTTDMQLFQFDGVGYRRTECTIVERDDDIGNALNRPRVTRTPCR